MLLFFSTLEKAGLGSIGDTVTEDTEDTGLLSNFILS